MESHIRSNRYFTPTRINSLYSDFERLRILNPEGFEANVNAWADLFSELLLKGCFLPTSRLSISTKTSRDLAQYLAVSPNGSPIALGLVLKELVKDGVLVPWTAYELSVESYYKVLQTSTSVMDYFSASKWVSWGIEKVGLKGDYKSQNSNGELIPQTYIYWSVLNDIGVQVEAALYKHATTKVIDEEEFTDIVESNIPALGKLTDLDLEILMVFLSRDRNSILYDGYYIKMLSNISDKSEELVITDGDKSVVSLRKSIRDHEKTQIEIELKITDIKAKMKMLDPKSDLTRSSMKKLLQLKKLFTNAYEQRSGSLIQLQKMLLTIEEASNNVSNFEILDKSNTILKSLNGKIDQEDIHQLIDEIDENTEITNDISRALGSATNSIDVEDEFDELERLAKQEEESSKAAKAAEQDVIRKLESLTLEQTARLPIDNKADNTNEKQTAQTKQEEKQSTEEMVPN